MLRFAPIQSQVKFLDVLKNRDNHYQNILRLLRIHHSMQEKIQALGNCFGLLEELVLKLFLQTLANQLVPFHLVALPCAAVKAWFVAVLVKVSFS